MNTYPTWKFHKTLPAVIVRSADEEEALGSAWSDSMETWFPQLTPQEPPVEDIPWRFGNCRNCGKPKHTARNCQASFEEQAAYRRQRALQEAQEREQRKINGTASNQFDTDRA
jgi:hypothetical protein